MGFVNEERHPQFGEWYPNRNKDAPPPRCHVVRNGAAEVQDFTEGCMKLEDLTLGANAKALKATVATAEPGASCWEATRHAGQKWYYILEGTLEVLVNDVWYLLSEGDSIYLGARSPHIWRNPSATRATRALVVTALS